eukprot:Gb_13676 [translate_table: standard]
MMQQMSSMAPQGPNPPSSTSSLMSSSPSPLQSQLPHHQALSASSLSLGLVPLTSSASHRPNHMLNPEPLQSAHPHAHPHPHASSELAQPQAQQTPSPAPPPSSSSSTLSRIKITDILPDDGAPTPVYTKAVEALSNSLTRHNAAIIELGAEDSALLRCALESAKLYFRTRAQGSNWPKPCGYPTAPSRGMYLYRAGRAIEEGESSPPCMADVFRCLGKASRAALSAIARHLRLRSDVFNPLLDDVPLSANEVSSSVLVATYTPPAPNGKGLLGSAKPNMLYEMEKGLLMLIASDSPGLQVCDPNGRWYLADNGSRPGDVLLLTGRALSHATAGLRHAASYRTISDLSSGSGIGGRTSLAFRLMPQSNAILDCSPISEAGHVIPQSYGPISVSQFMDDLIAEEAGMSNGSESPLETRRNQIQEPSLRTVLSDPFSGAFLEDALVARCGHSFGGTMLRKVYETSRCTSCGTEVDVASMVPNHALRAAAAAVKHEDDRRQLHNAAIRKRRKEAGEQGDRMKRISKDDVGLFTDRDGSRQSKGVQYPFAVNEKVMIKGNKRTPDKFVGREAIVTSQCLNGWYLLRALDTGESVRLQYRSLQKLMTQHNGVSEDHLQSQHLIANNS